MIFDSSHPRMQFLLIVAPSLSPSFALGRLTVGYFVRTKSVNSLGKDGAALLAPALKEMMGLKVLNLGSKC